MPWQNMAGCGDLLRSEVRSLGCLVLHCFSGASAGDRKQIYYTTRVHLHLGQTPIWATRRADACRLARRYPRADCLGDMFVPRNYQLRAEWTSSRGALPGSTGFSPMSGPSGGLAGWGVNPSRRVHPQPANRSPCSNSTDTKFDNIFLRIKLWILYASKRLIRNLLSKFA